MGKSNINIKYTCLGASKEVTGSCHLLSIYIGSKEYNIVVDYGMVQNGLKSLNELNKINKSPKPVRWDKIDSIILTHSHADHGCSLPIAIMQGYEGNIISTAPAIQLTRLILTDSAFIQDRECERYNATKEGKKNPIYPIYGQRHVEQTMERFRGYDYNKEIILNENISIELLPTGHLLGACSVYITVKDGEDIKRILFTGDTSANKKLPFTKKSNFKDLKIDYIFTESTYGNRKHSKSNVKTKLKNNIIETCVKNKGKLIIPVFSVGRSTTVLSYLYDIFQHNEELKDVPIYLASPMACKSHRIYGDDDSFNFYDKNNEKYKDMFSWDKVNYIEEYPIFEKEIMLNNKPMICLVASGMISGGYSVAISSQSLSNKNDTILFCGYQGLGCAGRTILESKVGQDIFIDNKNVVRKCNVDFMSMSSHADYIQITDMIKEMRHTKIKKIFLNHGDIDALKHFKEYLENELNCEIVISERDKKYTL